MARSDNIWDLTNTFDICQFLIKLKCQEDKCSFAYIPQSRAVKTLLRCGEIRLEVKKNICCQVTWRFLRVLNSVNTLHTTICTHVRIGYFIPRSAMFACVFYVPRRVTTELFECVHCCYLDSVWINVSNVKISPSQNPNQSSAVSTPSTHI